MESCCRHAARPSLLRGACSFLFALSIAGAPRAIDAQQNGARAPGLTVSAEWLAAHLDDPNLVLLHVGGRAEYDVEHIPRARLVDGRELSSSPSRAEGRLHLEMPPAGELRERLENLGVSDGSRVVVYFAADWFTHATRVLFTLVHAGLGANVSLLDGGLREWKRAGQQVTGAKTVKKGGKLLARFAAPLVVDAEWVRSHVRTPGVVIVDARAPVYYNGAAHPGQRSGHLPGAVNIPFNSVFDESYKVRSAAELGDIFRKAGVKPGDTVVAYCHIGQQATAILFAAHTLGHEVRLYDGSYQDWSGREDLPVEIGRPKEPR